MPKRGGHMTTDTPGIYRRGRLFVVRWKEDEKTRTRSFPDYESACAFKRDYVVPYRERRALPPTTLLPPRRSLGWVYVFQSGGETGPVKIGWSTDPTTRFRDLSVAHPHGLELVALLPGPKALEKALHARLAHRQLHREWFSYEALTDVLAELYEAPSLEVVA